MSRLKSQVNERVLTLYGRRGCHLCDEMAEAVKHSLVGRNVVLQQVDVDSDIALKARLDREVPLLFDGEQEICRHELNRVALEAWFNIDLCSKNSVTSC
jgi:hypothetical protein